MKEKIKNNFNLIIFVVTAVSMLIYSLRVVTNIGNDLNQDMIFTIIGWASFYATAALLIYGSIKNNFSKLLFYIFAFFLLGSVVGDVYGIIQGRYSSIYYLALEAGLFILFLLRELKPHKYVNVAFYIVFLTVVLMSVVPVLGGGFGSLAIAIQALTIAVIVIKKDLEIDNKKEESENE